MNKVINLSDYCSRLAADATRKGAALLDRADALKNMGFEKHFNDVVKAATPHNEAARKFKKLAKKYSNKGLHLVSISYILPSFTDDGRQK